MRAVFLWCLALFMISFPAQAEMCVTKEAHLALMADKYPKSINTDLEGELEKIFLANLSQQAGQDFLAYDVMIHRHPGVSTTLVVLFRDGCAELKGELPNSAVSELLGGREA